MSKKEQDALVEKIRARYENKNAVLEELKALDRRAKRPANVLCCALGGVGALTLGAGMSLILTDVGSAVGISDPMIPGIGLGSVGLVLTLANYPVHKCVMASRRKKYGQQILNLSDSLVGV